jgi:hypothetical protein
MNSIIELESKTIIDHFTLQVRVIGNSIDNSYICLFPCNQFYQKDHRKYVASSETVSDVLNYVVKHLMLNVATTNFKFIYKRHIIDRSVTLKSLMICEDDILKCTLLNVIEPSTNISHPIDIKDQNNGQAYMDKERKVKAISVTIPDHDTHYDDYYYPIDDRTTIYDLKVMISPLLACDPNEAHLSFATSHFLDNQLISTIYNPNHVLPTRLLVSSSVKTFIIKYANIKDTFHIKLRSYLSTFTLILKEISEQNKVPLEIIRLSVYGKVMLPSYYIDDYLGFGDTREIECDFISTNIPLSLPLFTTHS